ADRVDQRAVPVEDDEAVVAARRCHTPASVPAHQGDRFTALAMTVHVIARSAATKRSRCRAYRAGGVVGVGAAGAAAAWRPNGSAAPSLRATRSWIQC